MPGSSSTLCRMLYSGFLLSCCSVVLAQMASTPLAMCAGTRDQMIRYCQPIVASLNCGGLNGHSLSCGLEYPQVGS